MSFLLRNWVALVTAVFVSLAISVIQPGFALDRWWSDLGLTKQGLTADERYLIIEITEDDVRNYGGPPLPRETLAGLLEHLNTAGVSRVLVDLAFVSRQSPAGDSELGAAMKALGPDRLALPENLSGDLKTRPELLRHATRVDGRITPDRDGRIRSISIPADSLAGNPAIWLSTGEIDPSNVAFDIRIDANSIDYSSVEEAFQRKPQNLQGRLVIISAEPSLSYQHLRIPFSEISSRGRAIAVGAMSYGQGHNKVTVALDILGWIAVALFCIAGMIVGLRVNRKNNIAAAILISLVAALGLSLCFFKVGASAAPSSLFHVFWTTLAIGLFARFRVASIIRTFLRGNLTPEEAWCWNRYQDYQQPVLLIDASGHIRQHNKSAKHIVSSADNIAASLMPRLGQRENQIRLDTGSADASQIYRVEWPYPTIPLAVLFDISEQFDREARLVRELDTDSLTGILNRRGFDNALAELAASNSDFAVLYIDMNGFKAVNDTYGHDVGDELLKTAAERLHAAVRETDHVARLGGDEFGVIITRSITEEIARRISLEVEQALTFEYRHEGEVIVAGGAVGFALHTGGRPLSETIKRADEMMYERKRTLKRNAARPVAASA